MEKAKKNENGHTLKFIPMPVINTDIKHFFFTSHRVIFVLRLIRAKMLTVTFVKFSTKSFQLRCHFCLVFIR